MLVRESVVAGRFYPGDAEQCGADLDRLLQGEAPGEFGEEHLYGALVPHAGWICSGAVAGRALKALATSRQPDVIVMFGGVHRFRGREAALFGAGRWETPVGAVEVDGRLADRILGHTSLIVDDPFAHEEEHSLEVQMPFIKRLFPSAPIVPIMVPPGPPAHEVGEAVSRTLKSYQYDAAIVGTTDLTHYGPNYGFTPKGIGPSGNAWARDENDPSFIELVCALKADQVVGEAAARKNACSGGAVAATVAAVKAMGASKGVLLEHTTSASVLENAGMGKQDNSVGYAGIVFE